MDIGYDTARLAASYAFDRPPVHERLLHTARIATRPRWALDVGCGAGLSTRALAGVGHDAAVGLDAAAGHNVVGLEPAAAMLTHAGAVAPDASFVVGRAERLPFASATFELVTAAGSLNYVDLDAFLPECARVLTVDGLLVVYDFAEGRRADGDARLAWWFDAFEARYPWPPGYEDFSVSAVDFAGVGLRLDSYERHRVAVPMEGDAYLRYVLSDSNVDSAIARGATLSEIRRWCGSTLAEVFEDRVLDVEFDGYVACVRRA